MDSKSNFLPMCTSISQMDLLPSFPKAQNEDTMNNRSKNNAEFPCSSTNLPDFFTMILKAQN